jgi:hypothetical protein
MKGTLRELIDKLRARKQQYQHAFAKGAPAHEALVDLAKFCRAFDNDVVPGDHDRTLILAGRREAFFRIWRHLHLEPQELVALYRATVLPQEQQQ